MAIELVYETHSTTIDNETGIATGWLEGTLSEKGRMQAAELGERRRDDGLAAVFVSDLGRAIETAEIAFAESELPVHLDWRLRECNYGELNGAPVAEIDEAGRVRRIDEPFAGGESYRQVVERTRELSERPVSRAGRLARPADRPFGEPLGASASPAGSPARGGRRGAVRLAGGLGVRAPR